MFRSLSGYKSSYQSLTMLVASEFDEWRVLVCGPGVTIHGARQFGAEKAKEHAVALAREYLHEQKHQDVPDLQKVEWAPTSQEDWLIWR